MNKFSALKKVAAVGATALVSINVAWACAEPGTAGRPIRLVVSQQAGGSTDTIARMWAEQASKELGTTVLVENKPGAGGIIAAKSVLAQPADGCTLFLAGVSQMVLNKFAYAPLSYSPEKDFTPVATLTNVPFVLVANPQTGFRTLDNLVAAARARPGAINFASSGLGNSTHLVGEMLFKQRNLKVTHVPYKGEPDGVVATVSGQTQIMAPVLSTALPQIQAGKLVPLVVFAAKRVPDLPDVPAAPEIGLTGFEDIGWSGIAAKAGTPPASIQALHAATQKFLANPAVIEKMRSMQITPMPGPSNRLMELTVNDTVKWKSAIGDMDLRAR
ncbi:tripartite-type tricarboxylate transporter receptor subunit TctC [Cupriavidus gilardii J11]|uniref:Tripartite-type tricarboxylate transporter receptor subunit TctC n=1 Tax=Cupriavidus gilardii J11 TaxID=936133 RepID=A0A562B1P2_9BURK|nr:tripartite tricarboxylate transporter substrate binding protein [Cupriavidus gilardii]TWG79056.1 tripartite-type tricarboxylate transporter receptor subunit TctC [Cupriavidus gilardii J11]